MSTEQRAFASKQTLWEDTVGRKGRKSKEKSRLPVTCVYCGDRSICTKEHVIPRCLFPQEDRSPRSDLVIVPVCRECNEGKGDDDAYIRDSFTADIACSGNAVVRTVQKAAFRSAATNRSDLVRAAKSKMRIQAVESPSGLYLGHHHTIPLDWERVSRYFELVTRGLYWKKFAKRLPDDYAFKVLRVHASCYKELLHDAMENGGVCCPVIGEGVFGCSFRVIAEDPFSSLWLMCFYNSIFISVETGPPGFFSRFIKFDAKQKVFGFW
jgi:hypothetical protein